VFGARIDRAATARALAAIRIVAAVLLALSYPLLVGFGESPESRNRKGNRLYAEGDFDKALTEYRGAQVLAPDLPVLSFNAGDALFRKGEFPDAIREFGNAAASKDPILSSAALYNAGTAFMQAGQLDTAVEALKSSLKLNPGDVDAKQNLELALQMMQQQQQGQDQQNQDQQDQDQQNQDQQDQDQQNQDQQNQDQQNQDQQDQQQQNQDQQDQNQQNESQQDQQQNEEQDQARAQQDQTHQQGEQQAAMSKEEAERLLNAIQDEESELQEKLRAAKAAKREKVDKDW
jgi:Ca-activated chloride channel family protein